MILTSSERAEVEKHCAALKIFTRLDQPFELRGSTMSNDQAHGVMIASLLFKGGAKLDQQSSDALTEDYLDAIEDIPTWSVREAIRKWNRAESPKLEGKPHDFNWRPAPQILRQLASHEIAPVKARLLVLRDLLSAVPMIEFSDEHCAAMRSRLRLHGGVKIKTMAREPCSEAADDRP
jgi:hypothetical protein